jgi:hypothetical protein
MLPVNQAYSAVALAQPQNGIGNCVRLKIRPVLPIASRALPMDVQSTAAATPAPITDNSCRNGYLLIRGDNTPATSTTFRATLQNLLFGKTNHDQVTVSANGSKDFHTSRKRSRHPYHFQWRSRFEPFLLPHPYPLPKEREQPMHRSSLQSAATAEGRPWSLPLLPHVREEGRGEGEGTKRPFISLTKTRHVSL